MSDVVSNYQLRTFQVCPRLYKRTSGDPLAFEERPSWRCFSGHGEWFYEFQMSNLRAIG